MSSANSLPALTSDQVRALDRLACERFAIPVEWLMEAAGWQIARHCRRPTAVLCGTGNNGGDGLAAARHLHRWGRLRSVACVDRGRLQGPALLQALALEAAGVEIAAEPVWDGATVVLDALLGAGTSRPPSGRVADWIALINRSGRRVVSVDVPSGLDASTGVAHDPSVRAALTVSLALPKAGLLRGDGPAQAGEVWIADIGIPSAAYAVLGIEVPADLYAMHDRVQVVSA